MKMKILLFSVLITGAVASIASPVKSMLGSNGVAAEAEEGAWENPYITDGLIAMWDGEWNVAGGVHDPNATVWKDLSENGVLTPVEYGSFQDNCFSSSINNYNLESVYSLRSSKAEILSAIVDKNITVEIVFNVISGAERRGIFGISSKSDFHTTLGCYNIYTLGGWLCWGGSYRINVGYKGKTSWSFPCNGAVSRYYRNGIYVSQNSSGTGSHIESDFCLNSIGTSGGVLQIDYFCVRLYNRALTAEEVAYNYSIDKERFDLP